MFYLPKNTEIGKVIPKKNFESYFNSKQKKAFSENIKRLVWSNKLSIDTINLSGKEVQEIQVFTIELKHKIEIKDLLTIINKAIPYHIIFLVLFEEVYYLSTSVIHINPQNENLAVIDYTFTSDWKNLKDFPFTLELKTSLDWIFKNFCKQFTNRLISDSDNITQIITKQKEIDNLKREVEKLKSAISRSKQFNRKVELNLKLKTIEKKLNGLDNI